MAKKSDSSTLWIVGGIGLLFLLMRSRQQIQGTQTQQPNSVLPPGAQVVQHSGGTTQLIVPFDPSQGMVYTLPGGTPVEVGQVTTRDAGDTPVGIMQTNSPNSPNIGLPIFLGPPIKEPPVNGDTKQPGYYLPPPPQVEMN